MRKTQTETCVRKSGRHQRETDIESYTRVALERERQTEKLERGRQRERH